MVLVRNYAWPGSAPAAPPRRERALSPREQLLREIEAFRRAHPEVTTCGFGAQALNNSGFVELLERGRNPQPETVARVRAFMRDYRKGRG